MSLTRTFHVRVSEKDFHLWKYAARGKPISIWLREVATEAAREVYRCDQEREQMYRRSYPQTS